MNKFFFIFLFFTFFGFGQTGFKLRNKTEAKLFIDSLRKEILNGATFEVVAALYSEDPGSAKIGGRFPPSTRKEMAKIAPEFEVVAFSLSVGTISEVFETKFGFHILQVISHEMDKIEVKQILISFKSPN